MKAISVGDCNYNSRCFIGGRDSMPEFGVVYWDEEKRVMRFEKKKAENIWTLFEELKKSRVRVEMVFVPWELKYGELRWRRWVNRIR